MCDNQQGVDPIVNPSFNFPIVGNREYFSDNMPSCVHNLDESKSVTTRFTYDVRFQVVIERRL